MKIVYIISVMILLHAALSVVPVVADGDNDEPLQVHDDEVDVAEKLTEEELKQKMFKDVGAREGIDKVLSVEDLMASMGGGSGGAHQQQKQTEVPYEEISGTTSFIQPVPHSTVNGSVVEVQLNIATNTQNTTAFEEKFNNSNICLSIDGSEYSCWPIFRLSRYPRFAGVSPGSHNIIAKLVDPISGLFLEASTSNCTFHAVAINKTDEPTNAVTTTDKSPSTEKESEDAPETETVEIPSVSIEFPTEGIAVPDTFEVKLQILTSENITRFKKLFDNSFMCLSIDDAPSTCWPVFEERYFPKFSNVQPGAHKLIAEMSHPNDGTLIKGTSFGIRNFWVHDKDEGLVPMNLVDPSEGSTAFSEKMMKSVEEQRQKNEQQEGEEAKSVQSAFSQPSKSQVILHIAVNGESQALSVFKGDDYTLKAADFCYENNIRESSCVDQVLKQIHNEWEKKPQLEFVS